MSCLRPSTRSSSSAWNGQRSCPFQTVMVAPAPGFYATPGLGRDEVRIAYVLNTDDLEAAVRILAHALPAYRTARGLGPIEAPTGATAEAR